MYKNRESERNETVSLFHLRTLTSSSKITFSSDFTKILNSKHNDGLIWANSTKNNSFDKSNSFQNSSLDSQQSDFDYHSIKIAISHTVVTAIPIKSPDDTVIGLSTFSFIVLWADCELKIDEIVVTWLFRFLLAINRNNIVINQLFINTKK